MPNLAFLARSVERSHLEQRSGCLLPRRGQREALEQRRDRSAAEATDVAPIFFDELTPRLFSDTRRGMKTLFIASLSFLLCTSGWAAPFDWNGSWVGKCTIIPAFNGISEFEGSMEIQPLNTSDERYQWKSVYDFGGISPTEVRDYELHFEGDHYVVDEKNGLFLDYYVNGNALYSSFAFGGQIVSVRYEFQGNRVSIEMPLFANYVFRKTCFPSNAAICVESLPLNSVQRCELFRQ